MHYTILSPVIFVVIVGLTFSMVACQQTPQVPDIPEDYRTWHLTTDIVLDYPVPGHENHFRKIYINPHGEGFKITQKNNRAYCEFPEGTIIVKEIYGGTTTPAPQDLPVLLTVMIKDPEHPESRGGWVWLSQNYETKETHVIDYEFCVDCHANANEQHPYGDGNPDQEFRDYVYFTPGQTVPPQDSSSNDRNPDGY